MKSITNVWTVVYKEKGSEPLAFTYTSEKEAKLAKLMVEESDGGEVINDKGEFECCIDLEWCYLINGKLIMTQDDDKKGDD